MAAVDQLVRHIVDTTYDDLPASVLEPTKVQILDTVGVAVAGTWLGALNPLIDLVKEQGGEKEATILVYGDKVPASNAAMVNGYLGAVLDYEDTHSRCGVHISTAIVMPGFAMAEHIGGINGKDFMAVVALGFDLTARLGRAHTPKLQPGCFYPSASKYFGAAAVSGKLLNLSEAKMRNAFGIVMEEASVGMVGYREGATSKGANSGFSSRAAVTTALLAERGMTGDSDPIEGPNGLYLGLHNKCIPEILTVDLGKDYAGMTHGMKLYPCCRNTHNALDATLALVREHDIKPGDVTEVVIYIGPGALWMFQPEDRKYKPANRTQCQFSMPWTIASAIIHGKLGIDNFTEQAVRDKRTLDLAQRVIYKLEPEFASAITTEPTVVEIRMKGGEVYSKRVDACLGTSQNPASWGVVVDKFRDCCAHSIKPIPQGSVDKVVRMVESLEDVADATEIVRLLA